MRVGAPVRSSLPAIDATDSEIDAPMVELLRLRDRLHEADEHSSWAGPDPLCTAALRRENNS